jgi:biopolymer transport protein ExbB
MDNRPVTSRTLRRVLAFALLAAPAAALGQSATAPPHPSMPWGGVTTPIGQFVRFVYMPAQPVTLEYVVTGPAPALPPSEPPATAAEGEAKPAETPPPAEPAPAATAPYLVRQQVTIPGYHVRETTVGYHYPERWAIEQAGPNVYRWRVLPAQFVPK